MRAQRASGFTLIELMIVVAIIGVLAAIAVPEFIKFQLRSKMSEAKTNLSAIRVAEHAYNAAFDSFLAAPRTPGGGLLPSKRAWPSGTAFDTLGWSPEGDVYFDYAVQATATSFAAEAESNLDGDATTADFAYIQPAPGTLSGPPLVLTAGNCMPTGRMNPVTFVHDVLNSVGPCTPSDGASEY
jgi:type IV pilus assembly protein PilA